MKVSNVFKKFAAGGMMAGVILAGTTVCAGVLPAGITFAQEAEAPRVISITTDKQNAKPGDTVRVSATLSSDINVSAVSAVIIIKDNDDFGGRQVYMTKQADGSFAGDITIDNSWPDGETSIDNVYVEPQDGSSEFLKYYTYFDNKNDIKGDIHSDISEINFSGFSVRESKGDTQGPVINGVTFDKTEVKPGDTVTITIDATDENKIIFVDVTFIYRANDGAEYTLADVVPGDFLTPDENGVIKREIKIDDTWKNGTYDVYTVGGNDEFNNHSELGGAEVFTKLLDGFTVSGSKELSEEETGQSEESDYEIRGLDTKVHFKFLDEDENPVEGASLKLFTEKKNDEGGFSKDKEINVTKSGKDGVAIADINTKDSFVVTGIDLPAGYLLPEFNMDDLYVWEGKFGFHFSNDGGVMNNTKLYPNPGTVRDDLIDATDRDARDGVIEFEIYLRKDPDYVPETEPAQTTTAEGTKTTTVAQSNNKETGKANVNTAGNASNVVAVSGNGASVAAASTGDRTSVVLWIVVGAAGVAVAGTFAVWRKRVKDSK